MSLNDSNLHVHFILINFYVQYLNIHDHNYNKRAMMALELLTWTLQIVWYSIKEQGFKSQPLGYKYLTYWQNCDPRWPIFELVWDFINANILTKFHKYQIENVASRGYTKFSMIWHSNLVFNPTWPISKLIRDIVKANILTKFHEYRTKNVASTALTR